jgi:hypothetical protein
MRPSLASSQMNASEYIAFHNHRAPFITYSNHLFQVDFTCKFFLKGQCQEKRRQIGTQTYRTNTTNLIDAT